MQIAHCRDEDRDAWDRYVLCHDNASCYHLYAWKRAVERAYKHRSYYLVAWSTSASDGTAQPQNRVLGILPLFHLKHVWFGNQLVSLPFCDYGGILADDECVMHRLAQGSIELARTLGCATVELRHTTNLNSELFVASSRRNMNVELKSRKVRLVRELNSTLDVLWKSFGAKLRSQIRKPEKEGLLSSIGGLELLDDFYKVFSFNMRDLGSPVHAKFFLRAVLEEFRPASQLQVVYKNGTPVAGGLIICFRDTVFIPWASTIKKFNRLSPNMMLYWNFLKYAVDHGFRKFDFGRSTPDEGTFKFKTQWGATATPLHWQRASTASYGSDEPLLKEKYGRLVSLWKSLPISIANLIGPRLRKHISL